MKIRRIRLWICIISAVAACLWVAAERFFAPNLSAQNGFVICLSFGLLAWITTSSTFFQKFIGSTTPESLGAIRIVVCAIQLIMTLWMEDLPSSALLPIEIRHSMGVMNYFYALPGFENFTRSQTSLQIFEWLTALVLLLGLIGFQTRLTMALGAFLYLILGGILRQYTWFYHTGLIPVYIMFILALTPCGDALSVDRLLRIRWGQQVPVVDQPLPVYGWSRYTCWVVVAVSYLQAGLSKLHFSGFYWWDPENLKSMMLSGTLNPVQTNWEVSLKLVHAPAFFFAFLGIAGLYGELAYALVLVSKIARKILPIFMASVHIGIWILQNVVFLDLILIQLIFYDFTEIRQHIERWRKPHRRISEFKELPEPRLQRIPTTPLNFNAQIKAVAYPLLVSFLVVTMGFVWFKHQEYYPLTSLQMYTAYNNTGIIEYTKLMAHYEYGEVVRIFPDSIIYAPMNTRYRLTLKGCFLESKESVNQCDKLLGTLGTVYNSKVKPGERITQFEVQKKRWNFRSNPDDPNYGDLKSQHIYPIIN